MAMPTVAILLTMWLYTCQVRLVNGSLGRVVGFRAPGGGGGGGGGGGLVGGEEAEVELLPLVEFRGHAGTRSEGKTRRVLLEPERCEALPSYHPTTAACCLSLGGGG